MKKFMLILSTIIFSSYSLFYFVLSPIIIDRAVYSGDVMFVDYALRYGNTNRELWGKKLIKEWGHLTSRGSIDYGRKLLEIRKTEQPNDNSWGVMNSVSRSDMFKLLLEYKIDPNEFYEMGFTALEGLIYTFIHASPLQKQDILKSLNLILAHQANPCLLNSYSKHDAPERINRIQTVLEIAYDVKQQGTPEPYDIIKQYVKSCPLQPIKIYKPDETPTHRFPRGNPHIDHILSLAKKELGSTEWAFVKEKGIYPKNTNKCNLFVDDILRPLNAAPPYVNRGLIYEWRDKIFGTNRSTHPILAAGWADEKAWIPGWGIVKSPRAGDVAAYAFDYDQASGHVGIVSEVNGDDVKIISFLPKTQTVTETNLKDFMNSENHQLTYRRYGGLTGVYEPKN